MINAFWPWLQDLASNRDQRPDEWARVIEYFYRLPPIGRSRSYIEKLLLLMADPSIRRSFEDDKQIRLRQNRLSDVALSSLMFSASPKPENRTLTKQQQLRTPGESVKKLRPLVGSQLVSFLEYLIERGLPYESERKSVRQIADCLKSLGYHVKRTAFQEAIRQSNVLTDWRDKRLDEKLVERQRNWEHRSLEALGVTYFAASNLPEPVAMTDDEYEKLTERAIREAIVNRATDCEVSDLRKLVSDATTREERSRVAQLLEGYLSEGGREVAAASY